MSATFELFRDAAGCYRFHVKSASGEVTALSDTYPTRENAEVAIESIRHSAATTFVHPLPPDARMRRTPTQLIINADPEDPDGRSQWLWIRLPNGDLMFGCLPRATAISAPKLTATSDNTISNPHRQSHPAEVSNKEESIKHPGRAMLAIAVMLGMVDGGSIAVANPHF